MNNKKKKQQHSYLKEHKILCPNCNENSSWDICTNCWYYECLNCNAHFDVKDFYRKSNTVDTIIIPELHYSREGKIKFNKKKFSLSLSDNTIKMSQMFRLDAITKWRQI